MADLTTVSLQRFAQKMAGYKQADIMETLTHPQTLGTVGGAALGGLGLYGIARLLQSEEDRKRRGWTPALAGLTGALAGGAAGYMGTGSSPVSKALRANGYLQQSISGVDDKEPQYVNGEVNKALADAQNVAPPKLPARPINDRDYRPPSYRTPDVAEKKPVAAKADKPEKPTTKQPEAERDYRPPGFRN